MPFLLLLEENHLPWLSLLLYLQWMILPPNRLAPVTTHLPLMIADQPLMTSYLPLPITHLLLCNALAGVKARRWRLGSLWVGRVTWTGSNAGAGLPTRRFYYVLVLLGE